LAVHPLPKLVGAVGAAVVVGARQWLLLLM
jgi:hypothetical protein